MKFRLGGWLIILCIVSIANAKPTVPDVDLFGEGLKLIDSLCGSFGSGVETFFNIFKPKVDVLFQLRTPCKRSQYPVAKTNELRNSPDFDPNKKTVVFVSGWRSKMDEPYTEELTNAYHCRGGHNFIVVDTLDLIKGFYIVSAFHTNKLGEYVAMGLKNLNIPGENIHLIGHSLGAHIMGSAGHNFEKLTGKKIGRITGLDPARPCFADAPVYRKLGANDATFVDVIHSNSKEAGTEEAIGHADFYPGGLMSTQPSCQVSDIKCSHTMSIKYYAESVYNGNDGNFMGDQCANVRSVKAMKCGGIKTRMGFAADKNAKGLYVLGVKKTAPYGQQANPSVARKVERCGVCQK